MCERIASTLTLADLYLKHTHRGLKAKELYTLLNKEAVNTLFAFISQLVLMIRFHLPHGTSDRLGSLNTHQTSALWHHDCKSILRFESERVLSAIEKNKQIESFHSHPSMSTTMFQYAEMFFMFDILPYQWSVSRFSVNSPMFICILFFKVNPIYIWKFL